MNKRQLAQTCYVQGIKPAGYTLVVTCDGPAAFAGQLNGTYFGNDYRLACCVQNAICSEAIRRHGSKRA